MFLIRQRVVIVHLILLALLPGCAGSPMARWQLASGLEEVRAANRAHMLQLQLGMPKTDALQIMGTDEKKIWGGVGYSQRISNPYRTEVLNAKEGPLEVLYYYTDLQKQDGAITDDELSPLLFKDGALVGWGRAYLSETISKHEIRIR